MLEETLCRHHLNLESQLSLSLVGHFGLDVRLGMLAKAKIFVETERVPASEIHL